MLKSNRRLRDEVVGLGGSSIRSEEQASSGSPVPRTPEKSRAGGGGGGGGARGGGEEKIFVTVRVRPLSSRELARGDVADWECPDEHTVLFKHPLPDRSPYPASYAFGEFLPRIPQALPCTLILVASRGQTRQHEIC